MIRCYVRKPTAIGYDHGQAWVRAHVHRDGVLFAKFLACPLNAKQCRQLADWLVKAAKQIEDQE